MSKDSPNASKFQHPSVERAKTIDEHIPYQGLYEILKNQPEIDKPEEAVVHWFRSKDLRIQDNKALYHASQRAKNSYKPLFCIYLYCPEEILWHGTSAARIDFILETLRQIQLDLKKLNIPLVILNIKNRKEIIPTLVSFFEKHSVSHLYANYEYEIDELKRDYHLVEQMSKQVHFFFYHDQCILQPGTIHNAQNKPMKVFTPYYQLWLKRIQQFPKLIDTFPTPSQQDSKFQQNYMSLFDCSIPSLPKERNFSSTSERDRIRKLWPAGHHAGIKRLKQFIDEKIEDYAKTRNEPALDSSSRMSPYLASGMVSPREILSQIKKYNHNSSNFSIPGSSEGIHGWIREVAFREFYRQILVIHPHIAMNLPQNLKLESIHWEQDEERWIKWCEGRTGMPFIDAGMRQLNHEAYMHNRLRMNVASYLYCNLLIEYRRGERFFSEKLIDWDLANNTQGWEPSPTVFNPVLQAEKK